MRIIKFEGRQGRIRTRATKDFFLELV